MEKVGNMQEQMYNVSKDGNSKNKKETTVKGMKNASDGLFCKPDGAEERISGSEDNQQKLFKMKFKNRTEYTRTVGPFQSEIQHNWDIRNRRKRPWSIKKYLK